MNILLKFSIYLPWILRAALCSVIILGLCLALISLPARITQGCYPVTTLPAGWAVERAVDWESLFSSSSGWTGADGIYLILLSGNESLGSATNGRTLFVFRDTFTGEVNDAGERLPGSTVVNNTLAGLVRHRPDPAKIIFGRRTAWEIQNLYLYPTRLGRNPGTGTG